VAVAEWVIVSVPDEGESNSHRWWGHPDRIIKCIDAFIVHHNLYFGGRRNFPDEAMVSRRRDKGIITPQTPLQPLPERPLNTVV